MSTTRCDLGRDDALVNPDDAVFERLGDPPDAADVAAVEIGGDPSLGAPSLTLPRGRGREGWGNVGHLDCVCLALEAVERGDGPEGLLLGDDHVGRHVGQHRRLEEAAALRGALAASDNLGALLDGVGDVRLDLLDRLRVDQRADRRTRLEPVGDLHGTGGLGEALRKGVIDAFLHQDAVGAHTGLARIPIFRSGRVLDRHLGVGGV
jgi:hypothetical protein